MRRSVIYVCFDNADTGKLDYRYQEPVVSLAMVGIKIFDSQNIFLTA